TTSVSAKIIAVQSLSVTPASVSLLVGATQQLTVTATYSDGTTKDVTSQATYQAVDPNIATVNASGLLTGIAPGNTTINIAYAGRTTSVSAKIIAVQSLSVTPASVSLLVGATQQLTVTATFSDGTTQNATSLATYLEANKSIVTVNANGLITGSSSGITTITISYFGKSTSASVQVRAAEYVTFEESTVQTRSKTITIPNLKSIISVSVNTGNVTYSVSGNNVTINVSNGAYTRYTTSSYTPSKTVTTSVTRSDTNFPSTISYNDGTYSGTLSKSGSYTSQLISGSPAASKTVTDTRSGYGESYNSCENAQYIARNSLPSSISYSDAQGFSGTLSKVSTTNGPCTVHGSHSADDHWWSATATANYSGTVRKPDTRVYQYTQSYSGTVYGAPVTYYTYYYAYSVRIEYLADTASIASAVLNDQGLATSVADSNSNSNDNTVVYHVLRGEVGNRTVRKNIELDNSIVSIPQQHLFGENHTFNITRDGD
ncbi:hypothetical protein G3578_18475, partial [Brevibacillus sp. SYP-B805]|uniref:Ig-like domain-containing protein n=1 Tax=Brevibacillus sp. SYP-B805 TaxID=1578199 RepID=UPI0013FBD04D